MRSAFDFAPYRRSTVGFDRLFDMLENNSCRAGDENYPPFDLIKAGDNDYRIELAVAGFKPDEIDITAQQNVLIVSGRKSEETDEEGPGLHLPRDRQPLVRAALRACRPYPGRGADLKDGLLAIELVREIPEAMKPRKISVGSGSERQTIEAEAKA